MISIGENVGAQDDKDRLAYTKAYGVDAVGIHAADWGWTQRSRLLWVRV